MAGDGMVDVLGKESGGNHCGPNNGRPKSAHKHFKKAQFKNDVPVIGTIGFSRPTNLLRSYADGSYVWEMTN